MPETFEAAAAASIRARRARPGVSTDGQRRRQPDQRPPRGEDRGALSCLGHVTVMFQAC